MARDRIIYNVEGLFVGPYSGEQNQYTSYYLSGYQILKKLEKIQSFNYSIQKNELNTQGFGQKQNIFRGQGLAPEVTFNFSYIPDGVTNENKLNFNVGNFNNLYTLPMFSGLCTNDSLLNKRDFYLIINKNYNDLLTNEPLTYDAIYPTGFTDVADPNSENYGVLNFQNSYLNEYSFNISVGNIPEVNQSYIADNITYYSSGLNIPYSILNLKSGFAENQSDKILIPKTFNYNDPNISGQNILLPGDANITFYTNSNGVAFYTDTIQSLDFNLNFNRKAYRAVNYKLPLLRKIEFPINGTLNTSFTIKETLTGSFLQTLNSDDDYNIVVNFNKCNNTNGVYPTRFIFSGCKFNNINYDSSIGSNKTANLSFNFDLDPDFGRRGIFASGNILYDSYGTFPYPYQQMINNNSLIPYNQFKNLPTQDGNAKWTEQAPPGWSQYGPYYNIFLKYYLKTNGDAENIPNGGGRIHSLKAASFGSSLGLPKNINITKNPISTTNSANDWSLFYIIYTVPITTQTYVNFGSFYKVLSQDPLRSLNFGGIGLYFTKGGRQSYLNYSIIHGGGVNLLGNSSTYTYFNTYDGSKVYEAYSQWLGQPIIKFKKLAETSQSSIFNQWQFLDYQVIIPTFVSSPQDDGTTGKADSCTIMIFFGENNSYLDDTSGVNTGAVQFLYPFLNLT